MPGTRSVSGFWFEGVWNICMSLLHEFLSLSPKHKVWSVPKPQTLKHHFATNTIWMLLTISLMLLSSEKIRGQVALLDFHLCTQPHQEVTLLYKPILCHHHVSLYPVRGWPLYSLCRASLSVFYTCMSPSVLTLCWCFSIFSKFQCCDGPWLLALCQKAECHSSLGLLCPCTCSLYHTHQTTANVLLNLPTGFQFQSFGYFQFISTNDGM